MNRGLLTHETGTLEKLIRGICKAFLCVLAVTLAFAGWNGRCYMPPDDAKRVLLPVVRHLVMQELASTGTVSDLDARLRTESPHLIGLDGYRVETKHSKDGYVIRIEPTGWCFCRPTYVLLDGGKRLKIIQPLIGRYE